jgi:hypothetical protein
MAKKHEKHNITTPDHICSLTTSPELHTMADKAYADTPTHARLTTKQNTATNKFIRRTVFTGFLNNIDGSIQLSHVFTSRLPVPLAGVDNTLL